VIGSDHVLASTLGNRVAALLRQRILGRAPGYQPGSRLFAARIGAELGVSITPVREALQLLAAEHLLDLSPHRGVRVAHISPEEFEDVLRVLGALQALAVRFRGGRFSSVDIAQLSESLKACQAALERNDVPAYRQHDHDFHHRLMALGRSPKLTSLYEILSAQAAILEIYFPHQPESMGASLAEHWELVRQLAEGDPAKSELAMEEHGRRSVDRARQAYQQILADSSDSVANGPALPRLEA
jgi:DNA-binding GntR family transcriptional regulator